MTPFINKKNAEFLNAIQEYKFTPQKAMKSTHLYTWPAVIAEGPAKAAFFKTHSVN